MLGQVNLLLRSIPRIKQFSPLSRKTTQNLLVNFPCHQRNQHTISDYPIPHMIPKGFDDVVDTYHINHAKYLDCLATLQNRRHKNLAARHITIHQYMFLFMSTPNLHREALYNVFLKRNVRVIETPSSFQERKVMKCFKGLRKPGTKSLAMCFDGACDAAGNAAGSVVCRNYETGHLYFRHSFPIKGVDASFAVELEAGRESFRRLKLAADQELKGLVFDELVTANDNESLVTKLCGWGALPPPKSEYDPFCEIFSVARRYPNFQFNHIFRESNKEADLLCKIEFAKIKGEDQGKITSLENQLDDLMAQYELERLERVDFRFQD